MGRRARPMGGAVGRWGQPRGGARRGCGGPAKAMVYSPRPREEKGGKMDELGARVDELERIAGALGDVPDEELADTLAEAVRVLGEINRRIEARVEAGGGAGRGAGC